MSGRRTGKRFRFLYQLGVRTSASPSLAVGGVGVPGLVAAVASVRDAQRVAVTEQRGEQVPSCGAAEFPRSLARVGKRSPGSAGCLSKIVRTDYRRPT